MHWGTFILSQEAVDEPINEIKSKLKNQGFDGAIFYFKTR